MSEVINLKDKKFEKFGSTEHFQAIDEISQPHPYTITPRHVAHAADNFSGRLGEDAIADAEKHGASCGVRGCQLTMAEHRRGLVIACSVDPQASDEFGYELQNYMRSISDLAESEGFTGFALLDKFTHTH